MTPPRLFRTPIRLLASMPCALLLLVRVPEASTSPAVADARFDLISTLVEDRMKEYGIPGAALGISCEGTRLTRGFGITSVENPLPVTETTLFQAGSITKTLTATVVMRLVEAGRLDLDAPVRRYLPGFRVRDEEASRRATLRILLTHMGGWEGDFFDDPGDGDAALARVVDRMAGLEQVVPFDTIWSYNNAGFYVAGRLIEVATGKPYEDALRELLIEPLGLHHAFIFPKDVMTHRFAVGHAGPVEAPIVLRPWVLARVAHPAGGLITSVDDLLRYGELHLGSGSSSGGDQLLSEQSMRELHATQLVKHGTDGEMAIGWQVSHVGDFREVWHDGATLGQQSLLSLVPSKRLGVALLTNSVRGERLARDVRRAVAREYLGVTVSDPEPIPVPAAELAQYAGRYSRPFMDVVVTVSEDRLMIQRVQKQGFPTPASPVPPPPPPVPYRFYAADRLIGQGPVQGDRAEFIRGPDGSVGWIRVGGRAAPRVAPAP